MLVSVSTYSGVHPLLHTVRTYMVCVIVFPLQVQVEGLVGLPLGSQETLSSLKQFALKGVEII